jgi:5-methylcytosine-specific restriction endonuclease McrA
VSGAWGKGSTRAWRKTRAYVLDRDKWRCQVRGPGCTVYADQVHHLYGKAQGDDPAGLVASCQACNLAVGDPNQGTRDPDPRPGTLW